MHTIDFVVSGKPEPQGRGQACVVRGRARVFSPAGTDVSRRDIREAYLASVRPEEPGLFEPMEPWEGPVELEVVYSFLRPKSTRKTAEHTSRPDLDNLDKMLLDALQGVAFRNDSQVVRKVSRKVYGSQPCTQVRLVFQDLPRGRGR